VSEGQESVAEGDAQEAPVPPDARTCSRQPCRAKPLRGSDTCWFHGDRSKRKGKSKPPSPSSPPPVDPWSLRTPEEVRMAMAKVARATYAGIMATKAGIAVPPGTTTLTAEEAATLNGALRTVLTGLAAEEKARAKDASSGEGANLLPAGARPPTPEEQEYIDEHDQPPPGTVAAIYILDQPEPEAK
jgi:hypothetical protein